MWEGKYTELSMEQGWKETICRVTGRTEWEEVDMQLPDQGRNRKICRVTNRTGWEGVAVKNC